MSEVWLRTNERAIRLSMIVPAAVTLIGIILAVWPGARSAWLLPVSLALLALGGGLLGLLAWQLRQPRLAYREGFLDVYLRAGAPIAVPIDIVEAFFLGSGPSLLQGHRETRVQNLVFRLADRATAWRQLPVKDVLGQWCDGYVTIRGTWCEPLTVDLVNRLNRRLNEAKRELLAEERA